MTDSRASRGVVQALTTPIPNARASRGVVQVMTSTTAFVHYLRTVGSPAPVKMKQSDGSWAPMKAKG
jgi:hypothetical protein